MEKIISKNMLIDVVILKKIVMKIVTNMIRIIAIVKIVNVNVANALKEKRD